MRLFLRVLPFVLGAFLTFPAQIEQKAAVIRDPEPSFRDVLSLRSVGSPVISPDGKNILFTVRQTNWDENRYDTEVWLARDGEAPFQLTRTSDDSSYSPAWSPDGRWISFLSQRGASAGQIFIISSSGGEAFPLTEHETGVDSYAWAPSGARIAFLSTEPPDPEDIARERQFGRFELAGAETQATHLWIVDVEPGKKAKERRLTSGEKFTVFNFSWSPDGKEIAFANIPDYRLESSQADISVLDVDSGEIRPLVSKPGPDHSPFWSPDGRWIGFLTRPEDTRIYQNGDIAKIPSAGGPITVLTAAFEEAPYPVKWTAEGIVFMSAGRSSFGLHLLDPENGVISAISPHPESILEASFTDDGRAAALCGFDRTTLPEIYRAGPDSWTPRAVTRMTEQTAGWRTGTRDVVEWKSRDGTPIEGILWKPDGFEGGRKYPLLVVIHGGPASVSLPTLVPNSPYPCLAWLQKGALILEPNYRGSCGYGVKFQSLNVRNLGFGEMEDVESGVDALVAEGLVDPDRVGAMGWSHGGFVSAFLATHSTKFKAFSVGAGTSDWMTSYVNMDIPMFVRHYLDATPWDDIEIYRKSSPITSIRLAQTPTLIQHGEFDRRVPIPNAYELYKGLKDRGIPTKFIIYKGSGHSISRPKERLAANWHNWQWFATYIWGEEVVLPAGLEREK